MASGSTKFKNSIHLDPQSADPSSPAEGDIFYSDGTSQDEGLHFYKDASWNKLLTGAVPPSFTTVTKTTTATLATSGEDNVLVDATTASFTVTLPAASGNSGVTYKITKTTPANIVTIDGNASETIGGNTSILMGAKNDSIIITCDGSNWYFLSDNRKVVLNQNGDGTTQSITENSITKITVLATDTDTIGKWDSGNSRYDIDETGYYDIVGALRYAADIDNDEIRMSAFIYVNDVQSFSGDWSGNGSSTQKIAVSVTALGVPLTAGDYVDLRAFQRNSDNDALTIDGDAKYCYLHIVKRN
jgi:hypothetical protein